MGKVLVLALTTAVFAQDVTGVLGKLLLTNVGDPAKVRVILINAAGTACDRSVIIGGAVPVKMPGAPDGFLSDAAEIDIATRVRPGCWIKKDLAGLVVMAPDRAVSFVPGAFVNIGLTNYKIEMRPARELVIEVWPAAEEFVSAARDDLANFDWILEKQMAGIRLKPQFHPASDANRNITCEGAPFAKSYTKGLINLYYGGGRSNESCVDNSAVLIHNIPVLGDVAHEIGHKLGLNQGDSERDYSAGHTTNQPGFTCDNIMWTLSEVLKQNLSIGQAAWLGLSCSSFLAAQGACIPCPAVDSAAGEVPSPCPRFSLRPTETPEALTAETPTTCPFNCPVDQAKGLLEVQPATETPNPDGRLRLCTRSDLRRRLVDRFRQLSNHVSDRPALQLSTNSEEAFVASWMDRIATILTIEAIWTDCKSNPDGNPVASQAELSYLDNQFKNGPLKGHDYLMYARQKMSLGEHKPHCDMGDQPKRK